VVVRRGDRVLRSELLPPEQPYVLTAGGNDHTLPAPTGDQVLENEICGYTVYQRLVRANDMQLTAQDFFKSMKSPEMRTPLLAAFVLLFLITGLIVAIPQKPSEELTEMTPDNKYTRMIYDAELVKKRRAEAREMRKTISRAAPAAPEQKNVVTTPVKSKGATPKVVKIAKRANTKGPMINAIGKTADQQGTGAVTTVASVGSLQGVATQAGNGGETYKVGGVGTLGKGGGGRGVAGLGGLAAGGAGSGTVGILDEETEIEGGLDKEVIARVIAGYLGEIRYCYERQLSAEPDIYGKVQVKFTIDPEGRVAEHRVGATTLKSAMVEGCILRRLARWKFPKPKGGTHVLVTYPFMFKATN
jgi:outer membrane biosynthesis protein TonB